MQLTHDGGLHACRVNGSLAGRVRRPGQRDVVGWGRAPTAPGRSSSPSRPLGGSSTGAPVVRLQRAHKLLLPVARM